MPDTPDMRGRKPNLERKSCGFKNIRIRVNWPKWMCFFRTQEQKKYKNCCRRCLMEIKLRSTQSFNIVAKPVQRVGFNNVVWWTEHFAKVETELLKSKNSINQRELRDIEEVCNFAPKASESCYNFDLSNGSYWRCRNYHTHLPSWYWNKNYFDRYKAITIKCFVSHRPFSCVVGRSVGQKNKQTNKQTNKTMNTWRGLASREGRAVM